MHAEPDVTRIVRSWLRTEQHESAARVLGNVLPQLDTTPQRQSVRPIVRARYMNDLNKVAIATAAVVVIAVIGMNLPSSGGVAGGPSASTPASTRPSITAQPAVTPHSSPLPASGAIDPGRYYLAQPDTLTQFTMPAGWSSGQVQIGSQWPGATTVSRRSTDGGGLLFLTLAHDVAQVKDDVCVGQGQEKYVDVGSTAADLTTALERQIARRPLEALVDPTDVMLGGYPATKFVLTYPVGCPGPEGRSVWVDTSPDSGGGILKDGTTTVYVVDVDGTRQVISSLHRAASDEEIAELDAMIASIQIEPAGVHPTVGLAIGANSYTVEGLPLTFSVPEGSGPQGMEGGGWERFGSISLNKSTRGPQGAEGMLYWTGFPDGAYADPCGLLSSLPETSSIAELAAAVSTAPGTELVTGPMDVSVGGYPARYVVVTVRQDLGCDPGYFFTWPDAEVGALWPQTNVGDTIRVWMVDVDGTRLFIAGETHRDVLPGVALTDAEARQLEREIQQIIASIQIE